MTLKQVLDKSIDFFKQKNFSQPRVDAEYLLTSALKLERIELYVNFEKILTPEEISLCRDLVVRRSKGEPVAYILGEKEFYGFPFKVTKDVLIPRPETEHIVDEVLEWVKQNHQHQNLSIVDLGAGTGCIGLSLAKKIPASTLLLVDLSEEALAVARINTNLNELSGRVQFLNRDVSQIGPSDLEKGAEGHIVVANPPYIDRKDPEVEKGVLDYEPHLALFSENKGLRHAEEWLTKVKELFPENKIICFEFGVGQEEHLRELSRKIWPNADIKIIKDYSSRPRVLKIVQK